MFTQTSFVIFGLLAGVGFLLTLSNVRWGVFLLTAITVSNVFWEELFPLELDKMIGVTILLVFWARLTIGNNKWKRSIIDLPVLILILSGLITLATQAFRGSEYFIETGSEVISLIMIMGMALVVVQILDSRKAIQQTLQVFTITATFVSLVTLILFVSGRKSIQIGGVELTFFSRWGGVQARLGGIYEQPNTFAVPLVLALPTGIAFALIGKAWTQRLLWMMAVVICSTALLLSQSRGGILGGLLGLFVMALIFVKSGRSLKYMSAIFTMALAVIGILSATGMLDPVFERLSWGYYVFQQTTGTEPSRLEIWSKALALAFHNPFGYGAETKYLVGAALGLPQKSVHNVFVGYLASLGALGFIGVLMLAFSPLRRLWRLIWTSDDKEWQLLSAGLLAGLVGLWVHNLFHSMIHWAAVWIYLACVAAMLRCNITERRKPHERSEFTAYRGDGLSAG